MSSTPFTICLSTIDAAKRAERLAELLVGKKLVACVTILPRAVSVYRWKGKIEKNREWVLLMKTRAALLKRLEKEILAAHPYETPEFVVLPLSAGNGRYLKWLADVTA